MDSGHKNKKIGFYHPLAKKIIILIANSDYIESIDHTNEIFHRYKILKFDDIHKYFLCIYMFKVRNQGLYVTQHNINKRGWDLAQQTYQSVVVNI